ncbi:MAG: cation diffusion facilitator family transporter [Deltaproteobacteria bacterium]|nr:cation diffusion facilitator family transporter [Deltaproteobacteria bacterium]
MIERVKAIKKVLWVVLWLNVVVAVAKLAIGHSINSLAMMADGFHSLLDGSSNVIGLVGIHMSSRPPDEDHQYGHQKYEAFSAMAISVLMAFTAVEVVRMAVARLESGETASPDLWSVGVMLATMGVNWFVTRYESRQGNRLQSDILRADSEHTRSDVLVSMSVLAGLGAAWAGVFWMDGAVAILIAGLVLSISYSILRRTSSVLIDSTVLDSAEIKRVAMLVPEVISCTKVRSRGSQPYVFLDLDIQLDPDIPLWKAHRIAHKVVEACKKELDAWDVVVHVEPPEGGYPNRNGGLAAEITLGRADLP